jgi:hypothetical protein
VFSPDSKHLSYGARFQKLDYQPVTDGVIAPHNLQNFSTRNTPPILFPVFSYGPDGNHLAYVAFTMEPIPKGGVIVDGTMYEGRAADSNSLRGVRTANTSQRPSGVGTAGR